MAPAYWNHVPNHINAHCTANGNYLCGKYAHLLRLLIECWQIACTMGTKDRDRFFANILVPTTVCYIQRDISYTMQKSMIALNFLSVVVPLNAGLYSFEYVHRHSVGL